MITCRECHEATPAESRFCINCSAPVANTQATERLDNPTVNVPGRMIVFEGDSVRIEHFIPDEPLGWLLGQPIYEYSDKVWCNEFFYVNPNVRYTR